MIPRNPSKALALAALLTAALAPYALGQCILANPSFEIDGSGGDVFGGWNQFGVVGVVSESTHGSQAARVSGPNYGGWDVSGLWQSLDCEPGEQWEATGWVRHPATKPLTGQSAALVNVEWRDGGGNLIDYDSFTVLDAASPTDEYTPFSILSSPAPAGTVAARYLVGVLQAPGEASPDVTFDQVTFFSSSPPTMDQMQWQDFPGGRTLEFAHRIWRVKGPGYYGPGPSNFCHSSDCVWVDGEERLHLSIKNISSVWYSTEVVSELALGYGNYVFTLQGSVDQLDVHAVLGLFLWQYGPCYDPAFLWWNPFNEIDVEISRWGNPWRDIAQFVAQPFDWPGNIERFDASFGVDELSSYAFNWLPDRVEFRAWRGGPEDEAPENMIHAWTYTGPHIPRPEQPRVHMNLWQYDGHPDTDQEVIVADFEFTPADGATGLPGTPAQSPAEIPLARLYPASPNPFNPSTTLRYALREDAQVEISIHDVTGARLRTLVDRFVPAGEHEIRWDGRDDAGRRLASGVYLCALRAGGTVQGQRLALIK